MSMPRSPDLPEFVVTHADRMTRFIRSEIDRAKSTFERAGLEPQ